MEVSEQVYKGRVPSKTINGADANRSGHRSNKNVREDTSLSSLNKGRDGKSNKRDSGDWDDHPTRE